MRVLVLGGTRFIGPPTVARLVDAGHEVTVFHRGETEGKLPSEVRHLHGDRRDLAPHAAAFRRFDPDVLLDTLAMSWWPSSLV